MQDKHTHWLAVVSSLALYTKQDIRFEQHASCSGISAGPALPRSDVHEQRLQGFPFFFNKWKTEISEDIICEYISMK